MADLSITPANVIASANAQTSEVILAAATDAGEILARASGLGTKATAGGTEVQSVAWAMALSSGAEGQPVKVLTLGKVAIGAVVAVGQVFVLSAANPGKLAPPADLTEDDYMTLVAIAVSPTEIEFRPFATREQIPA